MDSFVIIFALVRFRDVTDTSAANRKACCIVFLIFAFLRFCFVKAQVSPLNIVEGNVV